ncbi:MAG TPA: hypothetical protein PLT04_00920 [Candidatus Saccharibacteria bacterium]|nr:hypothetical protein [Candidatus Saccharibacteria bacterium]
MTVEDFPTPIGSTLYIPPAVNGLGNELFPNQYFHWIGKPGDPGSDHAIALGRRTMFEGYVETGLAKPAAESDKHFLLDEIDKSGHLASGVVHFVARHKLDNADTATARLIDASDPTELATYGLVREGIEGKVVNVLREHISEGMKLQEMGALAKSFAAHRKDVDPNTTSTPGAAEIIRNVLGYTAGKNTVLYCSMVQEAQAGLVKVLSPDNLEVVGTPVVLEENEYRKETTLLPIIIYPDKFVDNIVKAINDAKDTRTQMRFAGSLMFFTDQLSSERLSDEANAAREFILPLMGTKKGA